MNIEDQLTNFELSKRLKELNVKQDSLFYWSKLSIQSEYKLELRTNIFTQEIILADCTDYISAFTVAELGILLKWKLLYIAGMPDDLLAYITDSDHTEADTRAKMLIYLIENKLIKLGNT